MASGHQLGRWGESIAQGFLEQCGYVCLQHQYRRPGGEIDLIMEKNGRLLIVEVKTRGRHCRVPAEAWVDARKLGRLRKLARQWMFEHPEQKYSEVRFDVVALNFQGENKGFELRHFTAVV